jgi:hypothetical protein
MKLGCSSTGVMGVVGDLVFAAGVMGGVGALIFAAGEVLEGNLGLWKEMSLLEVSVRGRDLGLAGSPVC